MSANVSSKSLVEYVIQFLLLLRSIRNLAIHYIGLGWDLERWFHFHL